MRENLERSSPIFDPGLATLAGDALPCCDVAIVGGGPAGSALSCQLAMQGLDVRLLEASADQGGKVGEGLPPTARPHLAELGLLDTVNATHRAAYGNASSWGGDALDEQDFIFSPYGSGWLLDRPLFERQLLDRARDLGATVHQATPLSAFGGGAEGWVLRAGGDSSLFTARFLVDASGRAAVLTRQLGARRQVLDRLLAFSVVFERPAPDPDGRVTIEGAADGWFYTAALPTAGDLPARRMVVYFTEPGSPTRRLAAELGGFLGLLRATRWVGALAGPDWRPAGEPAGHPAGSVRFTPAAGPGWLAVGDAAMAYDPLSSQGLRSAFEGARLAAEHVRRSLAGAGDEASPYLDFCLRHWSAYRDRRRDFYRLEQRWPDRPFWASRHGNPTAPAGGDESWPSPESASIPRSA